MPSPPGQGGFEGLGMRGQSEPEGSHAEVPYGGGGWVAPPSAVRASAVKYAPGFGACQAQTTRYCGV